MRRQQTTEERKRAEKVQAQTAKQITKQVNRGFKFNQRTLRKIYRLTSSPASALRPFEVKYLEQFSTQEKALSRARSFVSNPGGVVLSKAKGLAYSQLKESTVKGISSITGLSEKDSFSIVNAVASATKPENFVKNVAKNLANFITESVGLGDLGESVVDIVASFMESQETTAEERQNNEIVSRETIETEEPTEEATTEEAVIEVPAYLQDVEEYNDNTTSTYERDLSGVESLDLYIDEVKEYTAVQIAKNRDEYIDTSSEVETAISKLRRAQATEEKASKYIESHPFSEFRQRLEEATAVPDSEFDELNRISEAHESMWNFVSWL